MKTYGIKSFSNCFKINLARNRCIHASFSLYRVKNIRHLVWLLWSWKCYHHFGVNWTLLMLFWCCFVREHFISITYYNSTWILNSAHLAKGYNIQPQNFNSKDLRLINKDRNLTVWKNIPSIKFCLLYFSVSQAYMYFN